MRGGEQNLSIHADEGKQFRDVKDPKADGSAAEELTNAVPDIEARKITPETTIQTERDSEETQRLGRELASAYAEPATAERGDRAESKALASPIEFLPHLDPQAELNKLDDSQGLTGQNELARSKLYRSNRQIDFLRERFKSCDPKQGLEILNVGPANGEEAINYAVLAENAGLLDQTRMKFVDIRPRERVQPGYDLGMSIIQQPIRPAEADLKGFVFEGGTWKVNSRVRDKVEQSLDGADNHFGTPVENFLTGAASDDGRYDVVAFNNVAQYLGRGATRYDNPIYKSGGQAEQFKAVLLTTAEKVKPGGTLLMTVEKRPITGNARPEMVHQSLLEGTNFPGIFDVVSRKYGIYTRKSAEKLGMTPKS